MPLMLDDLRREFAQHLGADPAGRWRMDSALAHVITRAYEAGLRDGDVDIFPAAHRLALELECLLLSTNDMAALSKWWASAHEALEQWREIFEGNARVEGRDAASSRRVPSHDGLCGNGDGEEHEL